MKLLKMTAQLVICIAMVIAVGYGCSEARETWCTGSGAAVSIHNC